MNFTSFDLNLLRVFDALMRERSATRAGDRLGLSQPAVSAALNRLRHACGDKLFVRHGNDMVPTPRAEALSGPIRTALGGVEQALAGDLRFEPGKLERTFTVLGADIFSSFLVPMLWTRLSAEAPGVKLRFLDSARGDVERLLRDDLIDLALERPLELPDWASRRLLFRSPFVIIAARRNRILSKAGLKPGAKIPMALFTSLAHAIRSIDGGLSGLVDEALARSGAARRVVLAVPHFHGLAATVAASDLLAAVPVELARMVAKGFDLAVYDMPIEVPAPAIQMYWHRRHDRAPAHHWLRELIAAASDF